MYYLKYTSKLPIDLNKSWEFFSSPANLKEITPEHLDFKITNDLGDKGMYPGQIITYTIRPVFHIPIKWVTEITHVEKPYYFIDEQLFGPYKFWHHEHHFRPIKNGVEMIDILYYEMPFSFLGKFLNSIKVRQDVEQIFSYRQVKLEKLFGPYLES